MSRLKCDLEAEIEFMFQNMSDEPTKEEIEKLVELYKLYLEDEKMEYTHEENMRQKDIDESDATVNAWDKILLSIFGMVLSTGVSLLGYKLYRDCWAQGLEFEQTGKVCSKMVSNHLSGFRPKFFK